MKKTLPSGIDVQLGVHHVDDLELDSFPGQKLRGTKVRLTVSGQDYTGYSVCKPPDAFNKRMGRRCAANSLLRHIREVLPSKVDRKAVFGLICPEYQK